MITWRRNSKITMIGRVGEVDCFQITSQANGFELICDLPEALPNLYGRYITTHHTPQLAAKHAEQVLIHWQTRFES